MTEHEQATIIENENHQEQLPAEPPEQDTDVGNQPFDIAALLQTPELKAAIAEQVQEGVKNALKGQTPKTNTVLPSTTQKSEFERMTYQQRCKLFNTNPQEYKKLAEGEI